MAGTYSWVIEGNTPFDDITRTLEHLWQDEITDYAQHPHPKHVFCSLARIANWLNSSTDWTPQEYLLVWNAGNRDGWQISNKLRLPPRDRPDENSD